MPDESTMEGIASGFGIPVDRVRMAAARALRGYEDDGAPLSNDLSEISNDALLTEIRRRFESAQSGARRPVVDSPVTDDEREEFGWGRGRLDAAETPVEDRHENRQ